MDIFDLSTTTKIDGHDYLAAAFRFANLAVPHLEALAQNA